MFLLAKFGVDLQHGCDDVGHGTGSDHNEEESGVADGLLQGTGKESGNHHREGHEGCAECIVGSLVLALTIIYKV